MAFPTPQAPRSNPNRTFRFLDLPAELRNHIYEDALVISRKDASSSTEPKKTNGDDERRKSTADSGVVPLSNKKHASVSNDMSAITLCCGAALFEPRVEIFPHCGCKSIPYALNEDSEPSDNLTENGPHSSHNFALGLLRVCRQTHEEGTSIFYGKNAFKADTVALQHFLFQIGDTNAARLRRLCITDFFDGQLRYSTFKNDLYSILGWHQTTPADYHKFLAPRYYILAAATNLLTLELKHTGLWNELESVEVANYMVSQLGHWMRVCAKKNRTPKVACLEKISFVWPWGGCGCHKESGAGKEVCNKCQSKLLETLVTLLTSEE